MSEERVSGEGRDPDGVGYEPKVPAGYRRTEVGVIPEDWQVDRIDQHTLIKTGSKNTQDKEEGGEYPFFVRSADVERIGTYSYDGEAVLTAGDGVGTGKVFHYVRGRFDVHQRVYRISHFSHRLNGQYFFFQFSERFYHRIMSMTAKSSVDSVRMEMIAGMLLPLPSPREQRAIAAILSDVDELIGSLEALIAKKRAVKQAAMQELVTGRTRLPGFGGEWEARQLGEIASFLKGKGLAKTDLSPGGRQRCLHYGELFTTYGERIKEVLHGTDQGGGFVYSMRNDVLMPTSDVTPNGLATASCILIADVIVGGDILIIRAPESVLNGEFLAYAIKTQRDQVMQLVSGTTVFHLYGRDMDSFCFTVPPADEQQAIATVLSDMDAEIAVLEHRLDKTRAIKQGMMQQLLTGSIRLPIPDDDREDDGHEA